ncbi:MAG: 6,7-dimethyl-8-ribityllumazine synthase [Gammaproteobacteria bacterium]|jgi:6,7-dimethyl-8-ribityllumazine synthase
MSTYTLIEGGKSIDNANIAIVASRFNSFIVDRLVSACMETLQQAGLDETQVLLVRVPGAFEIPLAAKAMAEKDDCDAVIALGAVIRGETPHFEYICNECSHGLSRIAIELKKPVIFGVLTVDNAEQALVRAGEEESNKGAEAAQAAIEMINLMREID